ncbi:exonuclease domain-containing protein [Pseudomonas luteola]
MDYSKLVSFDMEMCCWNEGDRDVGEIISIGLVEIDLHRGVLLRESQYIVKPVKDAVSEYCTQLTGLTQALVNKQGKPLHDVLDSIKRKFGGPQKIYTAWGTDDQYLSKQCSELGIESSPIQSCLNAAQLYAIRKRHKGGRLSMVKAMASEGLTFQGKQHSALDDARNLARLILATDLF